MADFVNIPINGQLTFNGQIVGQVTVSAQPFGGSLQIQLPNQQPIQGQVLAATSVNGLVVALGWSTALSGPLLSSLVLNTTTVNGHALSSNVIVSASDLTTGTLPHSQLPALVSGDIPNNAANTTGSAGSLSAASALPNGTTAITQAASDNSANVATTAYVKALPIAVGAFVSGVLTDGQIVLYINVYPSIKFPAGALNSSAVAQTPVAGSPPAPAVVFHLKKNGGADFATVTFNPGATAGVWTQAFDTVFNGTTDILSIIAPATHDPTLANIGITLAGVRI